MMSCTDAKGNARVLYVGEELYIYIDRIWQCVLKCAECVSLLLYLRTYTMCHTHTTQILRNFYVARIRFIRP